MCSIKNSTIWFFFSHLQNIKRRNKYNVDSGVHFIFFNVNNFKLKIFSATAAQSFLKREWLDAEGQREKGAKHNENLQFLLK